MLNCNAVTTEASASIIGYSEAGMIHQKSLQLRHGVVIGFRLNLGRVGTLRKIASSGHGQFPGKCLTVNSGKEHSGPRGMSASSCLSEDVVGPTASIALGRG